MVASSTSSIAYEYCEKRREPRAGFAERRAHLIDSLRVPLAAKDLRSLDTPGSQKAQTADSLMLTTHSGLPTL